MCLSSFAASQITLSECVCFVDLLSLVISKKEIDISLLTVLAMVGYSSLFESMIWASVDMYMFFICMYTLHQCIHYCI